MHCTTNDRESRARIAAAAVRSARTGRGGRCRGDEAREVSAAAEVHDKVQVLGVLERPVQPHNARVRAPRHDGALHHHRGGLALALDVPLVHDLHRKVARRQRRRAAGARCAGAAGAAAEEWARKRFEVGARQPRTDALSRQTARASSAASSTRLPCAGDAERAAAGAGAAASGRTCSTRAYAPSPSSEPYAKSAGVKRGSGELPLAPPPAARSLAAAGDAAVWPARAAAGGIGGGKCCSSAGCAPSHSGDGGGTDIQRRARAWLAAAKAVAGAPTKACVQERGRRWDSPAECARNRERKRRGEIQRARSRDKCTGCRDFGRRDAAATALALLVVRAHLETEERDSGVRRAALKAPHAKHRAFVCALHLAEARLPAAAILCFGVLVAAACSWSTRSCGITFLARAPAL